MKIVRAAGGVGVGTSAGNAWEAGRFAAPYLRDDLLDAGVLVETLETAASWHDLPVRVRDAVREAIVSRPRRPARRALVGCHVSHLYPAGASLYFTVLAPASLRDPLGQWDAAKRAATDAIVAKGGTITHHHAVGTDHAPWLAAEIGELGVEVLRAVKAAARPGGHPESRQTAAMTDVRRPQPRSALLLIVHPTAGGGRGARQLPEVVQILRAAGVRRRLRAHAKHRARRRAGRARRRRGPGRRGGRGRRTRRPGGRSVRRERGAVRRAAGRSRKRLRARTRDQHAHPSRQRENSPTGVNAASTSVM